MDKRIERRRSPRYHIPSHTHIPASIRIGGESYLGKVINLSEQGFLMATERSAPRREEADWEIQYCGHAFRGHGSLDLRDATRACIAPDTSADLKPLIQLIGAAGRPLGTVARKENTAVIRGLLDFETARRLLRQIRAGDNEIDLSGCDDMNSSGLGVLLIAQKEGVRLKGCHGKVQRIAHIVGICRDCPPDSGCACRRAN